MVFYRNWLLNPIQNLQGKQLTLLHCQCVLLWAYCLTLLYILMNDSSLKNWHTHKHILIYLQFWFLPTHKDVTNILKVVSKILKKTRMTMPYMHAYQILLPTFCIPTSLKQSHFKQPKEMLQYSQDKWILRYIFSKSLLNSLFHRLLHKAYNEFHLLLISAVFQNYIGKVNLHNAVCVCLVIYPMKLQSYVHRMYQSYVVESFTEQSRSSA